MSRQFIADTSPKRVPLDARVVKDGVVPMSTCKATDLVKVNTLKLCALEPGSGKLCAVKTSPLQLCALEPGRVQICASQVGVLKLCAFEVSPPKLRVLEESSSKLCASEVGSPELCAPEGSTLEDSLCEIYAVTVRKPRRIFASIYFPILFGRLGKRLWTQVYISL